MAKRALKPCAKFGCDNLTRERYCEEHAGLYSVDKGQSQQRYDRFSRNQESRNFYNSVAWHKAKRQRLQMDNYLCQRCFEHKGKIVAADVVHHIKPLREYPALSLNLSNLVSLCHKCHNEIHTS